MTTTNVTSNKPMLTQRPLFVAGEGGYHTYRIPSLLRTSAGTHLAFAEGRKHGRGDAGEIDLVLRRSEDGGATWSDTQIVVSEPQMTCGNPCPVVDRHTGTIWLPFCKNLADGDETLINQGKAPRTVWITYSQDDGHSWTEPREITPAVKRDEWTWYATGPGHGIQLRSGRMLIPCDHVVGVHFERFQDPHHSHVIYSDDHGASWQIGGIVEEGTNECAVAELTDDSVYINCRSFQREKVRGVARSYNGGLTFDPVRWDETLIEPVCQAGLEALPDGRLLFSNPASRNRERMTVRLSDDGGRTWPISRALHDGPAAYSDLATLPGDNFICLYERGDEHPYETITLATFNMSWLMHAG